VKFCINAQNKNAHSKTCLVILHEIGTTHVKNKSVEIVSVACNCVVVIKTVNVDLTQFQFIIRAYTACGSWSFGSGLANIQTHQNVAMLVYNMTKAFVYGISHCSDKCFYMTINLTVVHALQLSATI